MQLFRIEHTRYEDLEAWGYYIMPEGKTIEEVEELVKQAKHNYSSAVEIDLPELGPYPQFDFTNSELTVGEVMVKQKEWMEIKELRKKIFKDNPDTFTKHLEKLGIERFNEYELHYDVKEVKVDWDDVLPAGSTAKY